MRFKRLMPKLKAYVSNSYTTSPIDIKAIIKMLKALNFFVDYHVINEIYRPEKLTQSDLIFLIPPRLSSSLQHIDRGVWDIEVGKGQYNEGLRPIQHDKPVFVFHQGDALKQIPSFKVSLLKENPNSHHIINPNSWRSKYGVLQSYVRGSDEPVDFTTFIDGFFSITSEPDIDFSLIPNNSNLLMLWNP